MNFQLLLISVTAQRHHPKTQSTLSLSQLRKSWNRPSHSQSRNASATKSYPIRNVFHLLTLAFALLVSIATEVRSDGPNCMQNGMGPQNLYHNGEMNPEYMWSRVGSKIYVPVVMDETYSKTLWSWPEMDSH